MTSLLPGPTSAAPGRGELRPPAPLAAGAGRPPRRRGRGRPRPWWSAWRSGSSAGSSPTRAPTARRATDCASARSAGCSPTARASRSTASRSRSSRSASPRSARGSSGGSGTGSATSISGHGPDADRIADGERDWTVPMAAVAVHRRLPRRGGRHSRAGRRRPRPRRRSARVVVLVGRCCPRPSAGPAIATGSGRLAIWATVVPPWLRAALAGGLRHPGGFLVVVDRGLPGRPGRSTSARRST